MGPRKNWTTPNSRGGGRSWGDLLVALFACACPPRTSRRRVLIRFWIAVLALNSVGLSSFNGEPALPGCQSATIPVRHFASQPMGRARERVSHFSGAVGRMEWARHSLQLAAAAMHARPTDPWSSPPPCLYNSVQQTAKTTAQVTLLPALWASALLEFIGCLSFFFFFFFSSPRRTPKKQVQSSLWNGNALDQCCCCQPTANQ